MKLTITAAAVTLAMGSTLWAADPAAMGQQSGQPSGQTPTGMQADPNAPAIGTTQAAPQGWTDLKGTVENVDASAKTIQIKDELGQSIQVPVDQAVKIQKDGKQVKLNQVQAGDTITLARKASSNPAFSTVWRGKTWRRLKHKRGSGWGVG
jgi:hypothetical protein